MNCDCEEPEAFSEQTRKARKAYTCGECLTLIPVGERYRYLSGIWDGTPGAYRFHVACDEARKVFGQLVWAAQRAARERARLASRAFDSVVMAAGAGKTHEEERRELREAEGALGAIDYLCDCVPFGGLGEAMQEYAREVLGYDTETGGPLKPWRPWTAGEVNEMRKGAAT